MVEVRTKHNGQAIDCDYCLHGYSGETLLDDRKTNGTPLGVHRMVMPEERLVKLTNHQEPALGWS